MKNDTNFGTKLILSVMGCFCAFESAPVARAATPPVGLWEQPCRGGVSRTENITSAASEGAGDAVGPSRAVLTEVFHREADCQNAQLSLISEGALAWPELPTGSATPEGASAIDFRFEKVSAVFLSQGGADAASASAFCGITGWEKDRAVEITGLSCAFVPGQKPWSVPRAGDARYGIYRVLPEGSSQSTGRVILQWGKMTRERTGLTPSLRPSEWDPQVYSLKNE